MPVVLNKMADNPSTAADFCNKICQEPTSPHSITSSALDDDKHRPSVRHASAKS
jgi:hypothetical protein